MGEVTEDLVQSEVGDYANPEVIKDNLQSLQGQAAWLARNFNDGREHTTRIKQDLEHLWVEFLTEKHFFRQFIEEHFSPI